MILFNCGICVLCPRMYSLSLSLNFVICRNSEPSSSLVQPLFKVDWMRAGYFVKGFFFFPPP